MTSWCNANLGSNVHHLFEDVDLVDAERNANLDRKKTTS